MKSRMRTTMSIGVASVLGGTCLATLGLAAEPFTVGAGAKYRSISSALLEMKDGDVCIIKEGVYRERINVPQNKVTLRGEGRVVITGCDEAGDGRPANLNGLDCLVFEVGKPVYEAFRGKQYLPQARFPNKTKPMTSNEDWAFSSIDGNGEVGFTEKDLTPPKGLDDGYFLGVGNFKTWFSLTLPITGVGANSRIQVDGESASSGYMGRYGKGRGMGYIIGARAAFDAPGEWYSDGGKVWIIPPADAPGNYEVRTRLDGVVIKGNGVRLENIRFRSATGRVEGNDALFSKCAFEYISPFRHNAHPKGKGDKQGQTMFSQWGSPENGSAGIFVKGDGFVAENCRFSKSWWCGIMLRGNRARIENCLFEDMNWIARRSAGLFSWGDDNVVRYCTLRNLGGAGVEGGNASWIEQYAKRNIWEYNYIEDVCKLIVDQGMFYVNHQRGHYPPADSVWRYNVAKTAKGPKKGGWSRCVAAYYVDNSSSGYRIHNNIAIDVINPMKLNDFMGIKESCRDVWYYNNTFFKCGSSAIGIKSAEARTRGGVNIINNLSVSGGGIPEKKRPKNTINNHVEKQASVLKNAKAMDFTPTREDLKRGGVPVQGKAIPYIGAVDPEKGMWRYGADESTLPEPY